MTRASSKTALVLITASCALLFAPARPSRASHQVIAADLITNADPAPVVAQPPGSEAQQLDTAASAIAGRPLHVLCYQHGEPGDPSLFGAWAYVDLFRPIINLSKEACDGALAIVNRDETVPLIEQAVGALSLTHEAYHLDLDLPLARRESEGQTECRAIKRVRQTMLELGASQDIADALLPWSLAAHFKKTTLSKKYDWPGCRVPVFSQFWR
jgi:hypothetical protein